MKRCPMIEVSPSDVGAVESPPCDEPAAWYAPDAGVFVCGAHAEGLREEDFLVIPVEGAIAYHLDGIMAWSAGGAADRLVSLRLASVVRHERALAALEHQPTLERVAREGFADGTPGPESASRAREGFKE